MSRLCSKLSSNIFNSPLSIRATVFVERAWFHIICPYVCQSPGFLHAFLLLTGTPLLFLECAMHTSLRTYPLVGVLSSRYGRAHSVCSPVPQAFSVLCALCCRRLTSMNCFSWLPSAVAPREHWQEAGEQEEAGSTDLPCNLGLFPPAWCFGQWLSSFTSGPTAVKQTFPLGYSSC